MTTDPSMLDELLKDCKTPEDVDGLHAQLLQRLINRALDAEMDSHLGYGKSERTEEGIKGDCPVRLSVTRRWHEWNVLLNKACSKSCRLRC